MIGAIAGAATAADILKNVDATVNKLAGSIGIGGVTQDRFIARTQEIYTAFDNAGYKSSNTKPTDNGLYKDFKIGKSQVTDKKTNGNYEPEFVRLHDYVQARLNMYNPGLGDLWSEYFPKFTLVNLGNISNADPALVAMKELIKAFKPGTYKPDAGANAIKSISTLTPEIMTAQSPSQIINTGVTGGNTAPVDDKKKLAGFYLVSDWTVYLIAIFALVIAYFLFK